MKASFYLFCIGYKKASPPLFLTTQVQTGATSWATTRTALSPWARSAPSAPTGPGSQSSSLVRLTVPIGRKDQNKLVLDE